MPTQSPVAWESLLTGSSDAASAAAAVPMLVGAVHRLAWDGPDEAGDRVRALGWLRKAIEALEQERPGLAAVLDWWQVATMDGAPVDLAWTIDREVPAPTGDTLRHILDSRSGRRLDDLRRPILLKRVLDELQSLSERNPGKIAGDKAILAEAIAEAKTLIRAAREDKPVPANLRLATLDQAGIEEWASTGTINRRVEPGTPVWDYLLKQLGQRAKLVKDAIRLWPPREQRTVIRLPTGWEKAVASVSGDLADVACALVADALESPGDRPVLEPKAALSVLSLPPADEKAKPRVFCLAREASTAAGKALPDWAKAVDARASRIAAEIADRQGTYQGDAADSLEAARAQLAALDLKGADDWLREADEQHHQATAGAERQRKRTHAKDRAAQLAALGRKVPTEGPDVDAWADDVDHAWNEARNELIGRADVIAAEAVSFGLRSTTELAEALASARQSVGKGHLTAAQNELAEASRLLAALTAAEDARLGPELVPLRDRARRLTAHQRDAVLQAIERGVERRAHGLSTHGLLADVAALLDRLERREGLAAVSVDDGHARPRRVAWVYGGVATEGEEPSRTLTTTRGIRLCAGAPNDAHKRLSAWGEVQVTPSTAAGPVYLADGADVVGPYNVDGGRTRPEHRWQAVGALPATKFAALFGRVDVAADRWLVPQPPTLEELVAAGAEVRDLLDGEAAAEWIAGNISGAPATDAIAEWVRNVEADDLPEAIRDARAARLATLLKRARALEGLRKTAVREYVASPDGKAAIAEAAEAVVARETEKIAAEVARRRVELDKELADARAAIEKAREDAARAETEARTRLEAVHADVQAAEELLADKKTRLLAQFLGGGVAGTGATSAPVDVSKPQATAPIRASGFVPTDVPSLAELVDDLSRRTWEREDVANLVLSMATGRWTLLAGLPGVGKSTFVRSVLSRLGHGPSTERYLELVVRRDWQDDAALFGFWHPTDRAWMPSSEGFVEHLLRAADDDRLGHGGMWPVLVEELNLASPEYYLARPISAFEAADPTIRLYDSELRPKNAERYPPAFRVPDSVRLVATVNVDDTVERLSPRFLSRASVIWVEARADAPLWRAEDDETGHRVRWSALRTLAERGQGDIGRIEQVVRFLQNARVPGAPTARTRVAMGRYLAASKGILDVTLAEDFQILQRVLPPLRGVGPRWRTLLDELVELLDRNGWKRSAARASDLRERGEELGDWYDFFHT